jgi:transposase
VVFWEFIGVASCVVAMTASLPWLFAGSLRAGKRAAAVMTLLNSARLNGHDPYAYMKDILRLLPTHKMSAICELLPHRWQPRQAVVIA